MRHTLRSLLFCALTVSTLSGMAQGHTLFVGGHAYPCTPALSGSTLTINVYGHDATFQSYTATMNANCYYYAELLVADTAGWVTVGVSCGNGTFAMDSLRYSLTPPFTNDVVVDLTCGSSPCHACFTVEESAPFTATFSSCSTGGSGQYDHLWDLSGPGGGGLVGDDVSHTFPSSGQYAACLNLTDDNGCTSSICHQVYVNADGGVSLDQPQACQACITSEQAQSDGQPTPFVLQLSSCSNGEGPLTLEWQLPNGTFSSQPEPTYQFNAPGAYGVCLHLTSANGCSSVVCDTVVVNANGGINTPIPWYDCLGVAWGNNTVGTPCQQNGISGRWDANCDCTVVHCTPLPETLTLSGGQMMTLCSNDSAGWFQSVSSLTLAMEPVSYAWTRPGLLPADTLPWITATNPGSYHLTVSNACSTSEVNFILIVTHAPDAGISTTVTMCGNSIPFSLISALEGTPDAGGTWSSPNSTVLPIFDPATMSPGVFTYMVTGMAPCANASATVTVLINDGQEWYEDADDDGLGDANVHITSCTRPEGFVANANDECPTVHGTAGNSCDDGDPATINDILTEDCMCWGHIPSDPCEAGFWIMQAYENGDTTGTGVPIPNTLWVWNLSHGGTGLYQFLWNFGDSTSSTLPFPTHTYAGSGPYILCLMVTDSQGCTDTHCDSLYVNDDGLYNGMMGSGGHRSTLTVNVVDPLTMAIREDNALNALSIWPNPVSEQLNIALDSRTSGTLHIEVIDLNGRSVLVRQDRIGTGSNRIQLSTERLPAGLYALRISNGSSTITQRFVRD